MQFKPTYLYVKKHVDTGLMYFGKTVANPLKYKGSGVYWNSHLNVHGNNQETVWHELFHNEEDLEEFATFFSEFRDIVKSDKWANLMVENGKIGGRNLSDEQYSTHMSHRIGIARPDDTRKKISTTRLARDYKHTEESKALISARMKGKTHSLDEEQRKEISDRNKDHMTYINAVGERLWLHKEDKRVLSGEYYSMVRGYVYTPEQNAANSQRKKGTSRVVDPEGNVRFIKTVLLNNEEYKDFVRQNTDEGKRRIINKGK